MHMCCLEPHPLPIVGKVSLDVDEVSASLDLGTSRPLVDPLVRGLILDLGRHLDEQFDSLPMPRPPSTRTSAELQVLVACLAPPWPRELLCRHHKG